MFNKEKMPADFIFSGLIQEKSVIYYFRFIFCCLIFFFIYWGGGGIHCLCFHVNANHYNGFDARYNCAVYPFD